MIIKLVIEAYKRIRAVEIDVEGKPVVLITGRNEQGKSAVLDAIENVLGGGHHDPEEPVHRGEKRARIVATTEAYTIERTFENGKRKTVLTDRSSGIRKDKPQSVLDQLFPSIGFDPGEFIRMSPADQGVLARRVLGLDWTEIDAEYKTLFDERTDLGRDLRRLEGALAELPEVEAPEGDGEDIEAFRVRHADAIHRQETLSGMEHRHDSAVTAQGPTRDLINKAEQALGRLEKELAASKVTLGHQVQAELSAAEAARNYSVGETPANVMDELNAALNRNTLREKAAARDQRVYDVAKSSEDIAGRTRQLDQIHAEKKKQLAACDMPVPGLDFTDDGSVMLGGFPFAQASQSQKVGAATALALKVCPSGLVLCRDGSFFDPEHLALMGKLADAEGGQIFIEKATGGEPMGFVIEDGALREVAGDGTAA